MLSKIKKHFIKLCPQFLLKSVVAMVHKGRIIRARAMMALNPKKEIWYCPCCGYRFNSFISGDYTQRQNRFDVSRYQHTKQDVLCPVCKSLPRHRILAFWCNGYIEMLEIVLEVIRIPGSLSKLESRQIAQYQICDHKCNDGGDYHS